MRLHRIRLTDYRGVVDRTVELGPGVTVVEGPNEVGKSSIAEALDLVFRVRCTSEKSEVRDLQPVGRDVGPRVEVELTTGPYRCTYATQWLKEPASTLTVHAPRREQHTGRAAHDRVRELLDATIDHDLWSLLRVEQGQGLAPAQLQTSDALATALDRAAQAGSDPAESTRLAERAEQAYLELHTAARGARRGPSLAHRQRADALRAELDGLQHQLAGAQRDAERHAEVVDRLDRAAVAVPELEQDVARAREELDALDALRRAVEDARVAATSADREAQLAVAAADARTRLADRVAELEGRLRGSRGTLAERRQQRDDLASRLAPLAAEVAAATSARDAAAAELRQVEERAADEREREQLRVLRRRSERAVALQRQLDALGPALDAGGPSPAELADLTAAERDLEVARAAHEQAATTLELTALTDLVLEGDLAEGPSVQVQAGTSTTIAADGVREVRVGDLLTLRLTPGVDHASTAAAVDEAQAAVQVALAACSAPSVGEARARGSAHGEALASAARLRAELAQQLDGVTAEQLSARVAALQDRLADVPVHEATREPSLWAEDDLEADVEAARAVVASASRELDRATAAHQALVTTVTDAERQVEVLAAREEAQAGELAAARDELDAARTAADDDTLQSDSTRATASAGAARRRLREQQELLDGADLRRREQLLQQAEDRLRRAHQREAALRTERDQLDGHIDAVRGRGLEEEVGRVAADLEHAEREARRLDRRAAATARLHTTLTRHRDSARRAWVEPLREELVDLGRRVFGDDLDVEVDDDLRIVARTLGGTSVPFEQLSVGAREQLGLVARLAAARLVDEVDGVPVLLDDVLGFADAERLAGMRRLLHHVGSDAQVVVLTCDAERFAGIDDAGLVSLR